MDIRKLDSNYIANTYKRFDVVFTEGKGATLKDENGKEYIDLGGGIAVNTFGIADDIWENAVSNQLKNLQHTSNLYYTEPQVLLAKALVEKSGMKKVFFSNSGAEANECMIKTARKYAHKKYGDSRSTIITLKNSFHGRTITTLAATGQDSFHKDFGPFTEGFAYAEPDDIDNMKQLVDKHTPAAIMIELVQGEGGVHALQPNYVKEVAALCEERDILLCVDEVQTGNGRTGALFAYMNYGVTPDIVSTAKGLGGGLPLGATLFGEKAEHTLTYGDHGSTFGGNPVCASGALSVLERLDDKLMEDVKTKSAYIFSALDGLLGIKSLDGMGLMIGIETEKDAGEIVANCLKKGVVALTAHGKVRLLPPLNIPMDALEKAVAILKEEIAI